jgi:hypothetical protein
MYIRMRATLGNTFVVSGAGSDQFQLLLANQSRFTSAIETFGKMEEGKDSNGLATVWCDSKLSMYIRMRVLPQVLLLAMGQVRINSTPFGQQWFSKAN